VEKKTDCAAELCPTVWTLAHYTKYGRIARDISLELAAFLGRHVGRLSERIGRKRKS
jgi:hypothetical protein